MRNGWGRQIEKERNSWIVGPEDWVAYEFDSSQQVEEVAVAFDSGMHLDPQMSCSAHCIGGFLTRLPETLAQQFVVEVKRDGAWQPHTRVEDNIHRYQRLAIGETCEGVRLRLVRFHGPVKESRLYTFVVR